MMEAIVPVEIHKHPRCCEEEGAGYLDYMIDPVGSKHSDTHSAGHDSEAQGSRGRTVSVNGSNSSVSQAITSQLSGLSKNA